MTDKMGLHDNDVGCASTWSWWCRSGPYRNVSAFTCTPNNVATCNIQHQLHFSLPEWRWQCTGV